jgi:hypothetical protein
MLQDSGDLTVSEKLSKLKLVCGSDGVHLKTEGTRNVAKNVKLCKKSATVPISGDARHSTLLEGIRLDSGTFYDLAP